MSGLAGERTGFLEDLGHQDIEKHLERHSALMLLVHYYMEAHTVLLLGQSMRFGRSQAEVPLHHKDLAWVQGGLGHSPDILLRRGPRLMVVPAQGADERVPVDGVFFRW